MECLRVGTNKQIKDFIKFPDKIYKHDNNTRDKKVEKEILTNKHILSQEFRAIGLLVYNNNTVVGRCIATIYSEVNQLYFGFLDLVNSSEVMLTITKELEHIAKEFNKSSIVGPIDCSFWIGYRLKINNFDTPYTCEPYNKDYYEQLLKASGFNTIETYSSNRYRIPKESDINEKYVKRLETVISSGYEIVHPTYNTFGKQLLEIYRLLSKLYKNFPYFTEIKEEQFYEMFKSLKYVLNYDMVYLVYKDNILKGFMVNVPNFKCLVYNINLSKFLKILMHKGNIKEYILLYMGVDSDSLGLGSGLAELVKRDLCKQECTSIGALIHSGKVSNNYYRNLIIDKYDYTLVGKTL